jgi:hypothetical protein
MSLVTKDNRISVKQFAAIPALAGLPAITRSAPSVSGVSSFQGPEDSGVNLNEGCMVTKVIKYTHQLGQFVNAVRGEDPSIVVSRLSSQKWLPGLIAELPQEKIIDDLAITGLEDFTLNHRSNLAFCEFKRCVQ